MQFNHDRVRANVRQATTEDLLDRVTVYRQGMEDEALVIIEDELRSRGVRGEEITDHALRRERDTLRLPDGSAAGCSFCHRPAVAHGWSWHRVWGLLPVFPRYFFYCDHHQPSSVARQK